MCQEFASPRSRNCSDLPTRLCMSRKEINERVHPCQFLQARRCRPRSPYDEFNVPLLERSPDFVDLRRGTMYRHLPVARSIYFVLRCNASDRLTRVIPAEHPCVLESSFPATNPSWP